MEKFYKTRMDQLEVTDENNKFWITNDQAEYPAPQRIKIDIFQEDSKGNIIINYWRLNRDQITYIKMGDGKMSHLNGKPQVWKQTRLKKPTGDRKYLMPAGQGVYPFIPPELVEAYEKKKDIDTLFLTEGAFKAWLAAKHGAMVIGLTSITHYRNKETGKLHPDIIELILKCNVKNVVILWDGDCLNISSKALYHKEDLITRPLGFYSAAKKIKELVEDIEIPKDREKLKTFFYSIKSDVYKSSPKGLDDLLIESKKEKKIEDVINEMHRVREQTSFFFYKKNITTTTSTLYKYFRLDKVDFFYHMHADIIQQNEFIYNEDVYLYNESKDKLEMIAPQWAVSVKWIGDEFFKIVDMPSADGINRSILVKRSKETLKDLYGKDFISHMKHYEGFCNVPNHLDYQQVLGKFYNRYFPFTHTSEEGECPKTIDFLKHIFGEEEKVHKGKSIPNWELGLDYLQNLILNPTQILPVIILYSPENSTGKSTFGKWQRYIFGHNSIQIGNSDFKNDFNEHWSDKLLVICEETLLDRKRDVEPIKAYATSNRISVNPKGQKQYEIDFFAKFQFYSNNKRMIYVNRNDERFWIMKVPKPKVGNHRLLEDLKDEVPAFLHFIKGREMAVKNESRMYFHPSLIKTSTFYQTVKVNEPQEAQNLREKMKEMFLDFGGDEILMPLKNINQEFFGGRGSIPWLKELLHDYLEVDKKRTKEGKTVQMRSEYLKWEKTFTDDGDETTRKIKVKFNDRPYLFNRIDFVTIDDEFELDELPK